VASRRESLFTPPTDALAPPRDEQEDAADGDENLRDSHDVSLRLSPGDARCGRFSGSPGFPSFLDRCWKTPKKLKSVWRGAFAGDMASTLSSEVWELREGLNVPPVPWRRDMPLPDEVDDPRKADRDRKYMENEARIRELRQQRKVLRMKAERRVAREKEGLPRAGMNRQQLIKYEAELVMNDMTKVVDGHTHEAEGDAGPNGTASLRPFVRGPGREDRGAAAESRVRKRPVRAGTNAKG
jgi:hypothetical protein